jgi:hypothetical protein
MESNSMGRVVLQLILTLALIWLTMVEPVMAQNGDPAATASSSPVPVRASGNISESITGGLTVSLMVMLGALWLWAQRHNGEDGEDALEADEEE